MDCLRRNKNEKEEEKNRFFGFELVNENCSSFFFSHSLMLLLKPKNNEKNEKKKNVSLWETVWNEIDEYDRMWKNTQLRFDIDTQENSFV